MRYGRLELRSGPRSGGRIGPERCRRKDRRGGRGKGGQLHCRDSQFVWALRKFLL